VLCAALAPSLASLGCDRLLGRSGGGSAGAPAGSAGAPASSATLVPERAWPEAARTQAIAEGKAAIDRNQCNRCHTIDDIAPADRSFHCTSCHVSLRALTPADHAYHSLSKKYGEAVLQRYQRNIQHLQRVPDLTAIGRRVRPDWIARFLAEPFDVRPALEESMIRHNMGEADLRAVVRYFAAVAQADDPYAPGFKPPPPPARPDEARLEQGKKLFLEKGCVACHTFGNLDTRLTAAQLTAGAFPSLLAPNLRFVRDRTRPDVLVAWIEAPDKVSPGTLMPSLNVAHAEAELLRDFLIHGDPALKPVPPPPSLTPPPVLTRPVAYEEMKERVLGKVCVHCHMNDYEKDNGPGNKGGFGYKGVSLAMRTYESLVSGATDDKGKRYSVLVPRPGEAVPPILQSMMRRRVEEQRDRVAAFADHERPAYPKERPGMPMGLPAMTDEEVSILATWIAQGCQGPSKESGMAGVSDGYLVPDGPLKKNRGCELRAPEPTRPSWAVDSKEIGRPASSAAGR
jgi:mono/diheme cytochrome c family protein